MGPRARLAAIALAVGAVLVVQGLRLRSSWLPLDEAAVADRARGGPASVAGDPASLYPLLLRPAAAVLDGSSLLDLGRVLAALLWAGAVIPAYALARRQASTPIASVLAALSVLLPAAVYATTMLPDASALLLATTSFALLASAWGGGRRWSLAGALACAIGAAAVRPWLAVLPPALILAYALPRTRWGAALAWPRPLATVLLLGFALIGIGGVSAELSTAIGAPGDVLKAAVAGAAAAAVGAAIVPWIAAWSQVSRALTDPIAALLVTAGPALALAAGAAAVAGTRTVDERPLIVLSPLVFALLGSFRLGSPAVRRAVLLSTCALAAAMLALPTPAQDPTLDAAPGLELAWTVLRDSGPTREEAGLALGVGTLLVGTVLALGRGRRGLWALPVVVTLLSGYVVASHRAGVAARDNETVAAAAPGSLDASVDGRGTVTLVTAGSPVPDVRLASLALTNRSLGPVVRIDPARADPGTGALDRAIATPYALAVGLELAGEAVAAHPLGTLVRIAEPARLAFVTEGIAADGLSGEQAVYRRLSGPREAVSLVAVVSRRAWSGPDVPGNVAVQVRASGADAGPPGRTIIHAGQEQRVTVRVPPPPFEVVVTVSPTFSPADFGQADTRQLGAQLAFLYPA